MNNIEIRQVKKLAKKTLRFTIAFPTQEYGNIVIKGIRVCESPKYEDIWVQPPSYNVYGSYHPTFFLENKSIWEEICVQLKDIYKKYIGSLESDLDIDLDDLIKNIN